MQDTVAQSGGTQMSQAVKQPAMLMSMDQIAANVLPLDMAVKTYYMMQHMRGANTPQVWMHCLECRTVHKAPVF